MTRRKKAIAVTIMADTERKVFNPKIFDNISVGEEIKSDNQILSREFFCNLDLPPSANDLETLEKLPTDTLADKEKTLETLFTLRAKLNDYNVVLADKNINDYQLYEKKSADLVALQFSDKTDEESISKVQAEISDLIKAGKQTNSERIYLMELLRAVNEKIDKTKSEINNDYKMLIASRLRQARENVGLTQRQLADSVGILRGRLTLYENGNREPDLYTLQKISKKLHISLDKLVTV